MVYFRIIPPGNNTLQCMIQHILHLILLLALCGEGKGGVHLITGHTGPEGA